MRTEYKGTDIGEQLRIVDEFEMVTSGGEREERRPGLLTPIYLKASIFTWIIRDPASPPEEVSVRFFNESLQIAFPNNVLVSKFHDECSKTLSSLRERLGREGWGEQSSFAFKAMCNKTACCRHSCFWKGKNGVVLHYHWEILTKLCYRLFIKTLKQG